MTKLTYSLCQPWLENSTFAMGLVPHPPEHSCDNLLLFTATMFVLLGLADEANRLPYGQFYTTMLERFRLEPGRFSRYPGETSSTSWDDYLGLAVCNVIVAQEIHAYAVAHDWTWDGNYLARIPIFEPTIRAATGLPLSIVSCVLACIPFVTDMFQPASSTNGRCTLYLAQKVLDGRNPLLTLAISLWRWKMARLYPTGMKDCYATYFGSQHPFALYGPEDFS